MARAAQQHSPKRIGTSHQRVKKHSIADTRRGTSSERGYSSRWASFSRDFRRINPLCEYCSAKGKIAASEVTDHDLPHNGCTEAFWDNTFTALCAPCHNGPKARAEARLSGDALLEWVARQKS